MKFIFAIIVFLFSIWWLVIFLYNNYFYIFWWYWLFSKTENILNFGLEDTFVKNLKSNIYLKKNNYSEANRLLTGNDYKYFFNKANIWFYALVSGDILEKIKTDTGFVRLNTQFKNILDYYNIAFDMSTWYDANKIFYNLSMFKNFVKQVYTYKCLDMWEEVFTLYSKAFESIKFYNTQFEIFKKQITYLHSKYKSDQKISQCLSEIYTNELSIYAKLKDIKYKLKDYLLKSWDNFRFLVENPYQCIERKSFFEISKNSLNNINQQLSGYISQISYLNELLKQEDKLLNFCINKEKFTKKENDKIKKSISQLDDLLNKKMPTYRENQERKMWKPKEDNKDWKAYKNHIPFPLNGAEQIREYIRSKSNSVWNHLNDIYQDTNYNPYDFLNKFFIKFFGNLKDYEKYK